MKNWKIHLLWAVAALVLAAALSRSLVSDSKDASQAEANKLKAEIRDLKSRLVRVDAPRTGKRSFRESAEASADLKPAEENKEKPDRASGERSSRRSETRKPRTPRTPEQILALMKSSKRDDRRRALRDIMELKDVNQKMALLREAVRIGDNDLKYRAVLNFDQLGAPAGTQLALEVLQSEEQSAWVRARAARELSQLKDPQSMGALQAAFLEDDSSMKYWSAKGLQAMGVNGPIRQLVASASVEINDPDGAVRREVVKRLGYLGSSDALPHLALALDDANSDVRRGALESLGNTGLTTAIPIIQQGLNDPKRRVREEAIDALYDIGDAQVIPILQGVLNDPDSSIVRRAESAIKRLQNPKRERD